MYMRRAAAIRTPNRRSRGPVAVTISLGARPRPPRRPSATPAARSSPLSRASRGPRRGWAAASAGSCPTGRRSAAARAPPPGAAEGAPRPATCGRVGKVVGWAAQVSQWLEGGRVRRRGQVRRRGGRVRQRSEVGGGTWRSEVRALYGSGSDSGGKRAWVAWRANRWWMGGVRLAWAAVAHTHAHAGVMAGRRSANWCVHVPCARRVRMRARRVWSSRSEVVRVPRARSHAPRACKWHSARSPARALTCPRASPCAAGRGPRSRRAAR